MKVIGPMRVLALASMAAIVVACVPIPVKQLKWISAPAEQAGLPDDADDKLRLADLVAVETRDGKKHRVQVIRMDQGGLVCITNDDRLFFVAYGDIKDLKVQRRRWTTVFLNLNPG